MIRLPGFLSSSDVWAGTEAHFKRPERRGLRDPADGQVGKPL